MGDEFRIDQLGAASPATRVVIGMVAGASGKKAKHQYLEGDRLGVKGVGPEWMGKQARRGDDVVRSRKLSCNCHCTCVAEYSKKNRKQQCECASPCTFRFEELYTYKGARNGTVQIIAHGTHAGGAPAVPAPAVSRRMRRDINKERRNGKAGPDSNRIPPETVKTELAGDGRPAAAGHPGDGTTL